MSNLAPYPDAPPHQGYEAQGRARGTESSPRILPRPGASGQTIEERNLVADPLELPPPPPLQRPQRPSMPADTRGRRGEARAASAEDAASERPHRDSAAFGAQHTSGRRAAGPAAAGPAGTGVLAQPPPAPTLARPAEPPSPSGAPRGDPGSKAGPNREARQQAPPPAPLPQSPPAAPPAPAPERDAAHGSDRLAVAAGKSSALAGMAEAVAVKGRARDPAGAVTSSWAGGEVPALDPARAASEPAAKKRARGRQAMGNEISEEHSEDHEALESAPKRRGPRRLGRASNQPTSGADPAQGSTQGTLPAALDQPVQGLEQTSAPSRKAQVEALPVYHPYWCYCEGSSEGSKCLDVVPWVSQWIKLS